ASLCQLALPPRSTLFPYTTLFRSLLLGVTLGIIRVLVHLHHQAAEAKVHGLLCHSAQALTASRYVTWVAQDLQFGESGLQAYREDRKSTRLNSSHVKISYAGCCLK